VQLLAGPMMPTTYRGERLGACTDCRRFWALHRAGKVDEQGIEEIEGNLATTAGTCAVMGTASTMASIAEALGMALPGSAAIPAVHSDRLRAAEASGARAVELAKNPLRPSQIITPRIGRERAARPARDRRLDECDRAPHRRSRPPRNRRIAPALNEVSDSTPGARRLKPTGQYYMSDLHAAGGIGAVLREMKPLLNLDCMTVAGITLGERLNREPAWVDRAVVRPFAEPLAKEGGLVALFGSLAPNGAILKRSAADPKLFEREGRAVVFHLPRRSRLRASTTRGSTSPPTIFSVLQNAGRNRATRCPEAGYLPIPAKLARAGVKDMVRHLRRRMSGTAYGTIVLHVSPEAAAGGPLALVRNGDRIRLSVKARSIDLAVAESALAQRRAQWKPPVAAPLRGYAKLYMDHVLQAEHGCDFDFLRKA
jgi:dihydroxy-acid dehydratase